eukprot:TRINITY_DN11228_c0_g1_i8.p1 TRINITY_DN11228_c0_g1~~TRINITY_DN11228_c0_g1_i8.p1  ORF type:complete len:207 (+),score=22.04 TRINITY_DN11228_c0_g1_i8:101-721(+)
MVLKTWLRVLAFSCYLDISSEYRDSYSLTMVYILLMMCVHVLDLFINAAYVAVVIFTCLPLTLLACCAAYCPVSCLRSTRLLSLLIYLDVVPNDVQPGETIEFIMANLHKNNYHAETHTEAVPCSICLVDFEEGAETIVLPCDERHYFHAECIQLWISSEGMFRWRKVSCPICRKDIAEEIRERQREEGKANQEEVKVELVVESNC